MKNLIRGKMCLLVGAVCASASMTLSAATIFDNTTSLQPNSPFWIPGNNVIVGDQVLFATNSGLGSFRMISQFSFQYATLSSDANWNMEARVSFYLNDGTPVSGYASPGTSIWDSGWFSVPYVSDDYATLLFTTVSDFPSIGVSAPYSTMTWTIEYRNGDANDQLGLALFSPPTTGSDYPDYWQYVSGNWQLLTNTLAPMNFGANFQANIPEPSSLALSILGGLSLLAWTRRMRR